MSGGWVYIMTNRANGTLYTGVTADISRRVWEHREGLVKGFTRRYGLKRLVYSGLTSRIRRTFQARGQCFILRSRWIASRMLS